MIFCFGSDPDLNLLGVHIQQIHISVVVVFFRRYNQDLINEVIALYLLKRIIK